MTVVFVHGNPETSAIWGPLTAVLGRDDVVLLSPPGFGAPLPDGFGATYRNTGTGLRASCARSTDRSISSVTTGAADTS